MEVANKPARGSQHRYLILLCLKDYQKVLTLGDLMTNGQFQVQEKPPADLGDAISSIVTEEGLCDTQPYYKYETRCCWS